MTTSPDWPCGNASAVFRPARNAPVKPGMKFLFRKSFSSENKF
jgi:hypothetical protein